MSARNSHQVADFYTSLIGLAPAAITTPIVRVSGGLAGYLLFGAATSTTFAAQFGPLFYMDGNMEGAATAAMNDVVRVSPMRVQTSALTCTDPVVAGMPLYLQDDGSVDNIKGTFPRQVGTVLAVIDAGARTVTWLFDGAVASKYWQENADALIPLQPVAPRISSEEFTIAAGNIAPYPTIADTTGVAVVLLSAVAAGLLNINLPPNPVQGQKLYVKDGSGNAAVNNIRVHGNGNTFEATATTEIDLVSNGTSAGIAFINGTWRALSGL